MSAELLTSRPTESDSTLILTLSNPGARNALHPDMYAAGIEALDSVERDPSMPSALVITCRLLQQMGRTEAAVEGFELAVKRVAMQVGLAERCEHQRA